MKKVIGIYSYDNGSCHSSCSQEIEENDFLDDVSDEYIKAYFKEKEYDNGDGCKLLEHIYVVEKEIKIK